MPRSIDPFQPEQIRRLVREFGSPLLIVDCARVRAQYRKLRQALPGVDLHYALKPLPHAAVVRTIVEAGRLARSGDHRRGAAAAVARASIRSAASTAIRSSAPRDIRNALQFGVRTFVADNPDEVRKFKRLRRARRAAAARVVPQSRARCAICRASSAAIRRTRCRWRSLAASLGVDVQGFSFHVGSQAADALKHVEAIEACTRLLAAARRARLGTLDTLDIGGGFPIDYLQHAVDIRRFCAPIRAALAKLPKRVRVIAEPGRYIAGPAAIGVATVMGRARREGHWWYYLDDGLYGSYSGQLYDHARYPVESLRAGRAAAAVGAGRPDLRQHRRHRREPDAAASSRPAT